MIAILSDNDKTLTINNISYIVKKYDSNFVYLDKDYDIRNVGEMFLMKLVTLHIK